MQTSERKVHFDVETAIRVLRQAGCYSHAVYLAEKHMHHEWYLKIQLEDIKVGAIAPLGRCLEQPGLALWGAFQSLLEDGWVATRLQQLPLILGTWSCCASGLRTGG